MTFSVLSVAEIEFRAGAIHCLICYSSDIPPIPVSIPLGVSNQAESIFHCLTVIRT